MEAADEGARVGNDLGAELEVARELLKVEEGAGADRGPALEFLTQEGELVRREAGLHRERVELEAEVFDRGGRADRLGGLEGEAELSAEGLDPAEHGKDLRVGRLGRRAEEEVVKVVEEMGGDVSLDDPMERLDQKVEDVGR